MKKSRKTFQVRVSDEFWDLLMIAKRETRMSFKELMDEAIKAKYSYLLERFRK